MLIQHLRQLEPFGGLGRAELDMVARHSQLLHLPERRWLLRDGRTLQGAYYLVRGRLRLWSPQRELTCYRRPSPQHVYPGARAICSRSAVQMLHVNLEPIAFLWESVSTGVGVELQGEPWLQRFLRSPLLQRLNPARWQPLLRAAEHRWLPAHATVISEGAAGAEFFVLRSGRALVRRSGRHLAELRPGDFFGEDALLTGAPRNASVDMLESGSLLVLQRGPFLKLLVQQVLSASAVCDAKVRSRLWVGCAPKDGWRHIPLQDLREERAGLASGGLYQVSGDSLGEAALAVLLLTQAGLRAVIQ